MKPSRPVLIATGIAAAVHSTTAGALAAASEDTPLDLRSVEPTRAGPADPGGGLLRTFFGLLVVLAAIYALYWVLRRVKESREERASGFGLESVASLPLGPGRALHMVRSGRELVLVGVSEQGVTPIRTYAEEQALAAGLLPDEGLGAEPVAAPPGRSPGPAGAGAGVRQMIDALRRRTERR